MLVIQLNIRRVDVVLDEEVVPQMAKALMHGLQRNGKDLRFCFTQDVQDQCISGCCVGRDDVVAQLTERK